MFSLSRKTDYALLILTALALRPGEYISLRTLASEHHLPYRFLSQVVQPLVQKKFVASKEGIGGGYRIAKDPTNITVKDVIVAEEGDIAIVSCLDKTKNFMCTHKRTCTVRHGIPLIQRTVLSALASHTIADLVTEQKAL